MAARWVRFHIFLLRMEMMFEIIFLFFFFLLKIYLSWIRLVGGVGEYCLHRQRMSRQTVNLSPHASFTHIQFFLPSTVKFFRYFTCISNSVILLKFIQRIYAYEIII